MRENPPIDKLEATELLSDKATRHPCMLKGCSPVCQGRPYKHDECLRQLNVNSHLFRQKNHQKKLSLTDKGPEAGEMILLHIHFGEMPRWASSSLPACLPPLLTHTSTPTPHPHPGHRHRQQQRQHLNIDTHQRQRNRHQHDRTPRQHPREEDLPLVEGMDPPPAVLPDEIVPAMAGVPSDHGHQDDPSEDREEEEDDEAAAGGALEVGVVLGHPLGQSRRVGEFPTLVELAVCLFEESAVFLQDSAAFGLGTGRGAAVFVAEEGLEHLLVDGEGGAFFPENVHVVVGHVDAAGHLFFSTGAGKGLKHGHLKAVALW